MTFSLKVETACWRLFAAIASLPARVKPGVSGLGICFALLMVTGLVTSPVTAESEKADFYFPKVEKHTLVSKVNGQAYVIQVLQPVSRVDGTESFPVLYMTDVNGRIPISEITRTMQTLGELPRFIIVGIGYPVETVFQSLYLRQRDLTPTEVDRPRYPIPVEGIVEVTEGKRSGGADAFLQFIETELKPFINAHYKTVPSDNGYFGHSLGGLFGLYVLFNKPEAFNRYILGSPAMWWDKEVIFDQAKTFLQAHERLNVHLYMAVGGTEELAEPEKHYVSNVFRMEALLKSKHIPGFVIETELFPKEGHASIFGMFHSRGLRAVYGNPHRLPFLPR